MAATAPDRHVVFMNFGVPGHVNPTLPVVAELAGRACKVTYFVGDNMRAAVESAGASWRPFRYPRSEFSGILTSSHPAELVLHPEDLREVGVPPDVPQDWFNFPMSVVYNAQLVLPRLMDDLRQLSPRPTAIVYEPSLACARAAAHALGIPSIGFLTLIGPGAAAVGQELTERMEAAPWVQQPRQWVLERCGLDVLESGTMTGFFSPLQNLVTTIEEMYSPPEPGHQTVRFGRLPFRCVGPMLDPGAARTEEVGQTARRGEGAEAVGKTAPRGEDGEESARAFSTLGSPLQRVREEKAGGRRVVLVTLGTIITGPGADRPFGNFALSNDGRPEGSRSLTEYTGKEFCGFVFKACFEALARDPLVLGVVALGMHRAELLRGLPDPPSNVVLLESVPQLQLLPLCDAFVTHGGSNGVHEALACGVPLCVVPAAGDQPLNADVVARLGAGVSFRHPLRSLSGEALSAALRSLLEGSEAAPNEFKARAKEISQQMAAAAGVRGAVDALFEAVAGAEG